MIRHGGGAPCAAQPNCGTWLAGESAKSPDHVCLYEMCASVNRFAHERLMLEGRPLVKPLQMWPLPVGARSIERWASLYQYLHGEAPDPRPCPLFATKREDAELGLVMRREGACWRLWFLGLLEPKIPGDYNSDFIFAPGWCLAEGLFDKPFADEARLCQTWYDHNLLGRPVTGRPIGPDVFPTEESLLEPARTAAAAILKSRRSISQERLVEHMGKQGTSCSVGTLQRWSAYYFGSWADFLALLRTPAA